MLDAAQVMRCCRPHVDAVNAGLVLYAFLHAGKTAFGLSKTRIMMAKMVSFLLFLRVDQPPLYHGPLFYEVSCCCTAVVYMPTIISCQ